MKKILKYCVVPLVMSAFLLCVTIMLLPVLVNVQKFLPQIEKQVAEHTGRPFSIGSDFGLTFFPWLSVTFSDMHLGDKDGVADDDFIKIDSFEARVKLLPLLVNRVEVSRFVVSGLNITLKHSADGTENYHLFDTSDGNKGSDKTFSHVNWLFDRDFLVDFFAVTGGTIRYENDESGERRDINDVMILLNNVSPDSKAKAEFKALINGVQLKGSGAVGPVSSRADSFFMDINILVNDRVEGTVQGDCSYKEDTPTCDLNVELPKFSIADLYMGSAAGRVRLNQTLELAGDVHTNMKNFTVVSGQGTMDDTIFTYNFDHNVDDETINRLDVHFEQLDLDRYFTDEKTAGTVQEDLTEWPIIDAIKSIPLAARIQGDRIKLADILLGNVDMQVDVHSGLMQVTEGTFALHGGVGTFDTEIDLNEQPVRLESRITLEGVQAQSLSKEIIGSPFVTGSLSGTFMLDRSDVSRSTPSDAFAGRGSIEIEGGVVKGLNLLTTESVRGGVSTEFEKLLVDFSLGSGIIRMEPLSLISKEGKSSLNAIVRLDDTSFTVSPESTTPGEDSLSITGRYGPAGLTVDGYTDAHETKVYETRDAQTLVDEKMPSPIEADVTDIVGTPLIDPAIVAQRFGLKPELIKLQKVKKAYNVGRGRVIIHELKELDSSR